MELTGAIVTRLESEMAAYDPYAGFRSAGGRFGPEDLHPSRILATRSYKENRLLKLGELYEVMFEADPDLFAIYLKVRDAFGQLPREIIPPTNTPEATKIAEFCHEALSEIEDFSVNIEHQCEALPKGIAFDEMIWGEMEGGEFNGAFVPKRMVDRPMDRFGFVRGKLFVRMPDGRAEALDGKFLVHRMGTKDSPWGRPLLDRLYWMYFCTKHGWNMYSHYIEKYAAPTAWVKYIRQKAADEAETKLANQREQQAAANIGRAFQANSSIATPDDMTLELVQANMNGAANYGEFISLCNRAKALIFLGEINTSGLRPGTGAYASDEHAGKLLRQKVVLLARGISSHFRDHLLRPMVRLNFGPQAPVPRMVFDELEVEELQARREGIKMLLEAGLPVVASDMYRAARSREPRDGEPTVTKSKADAGTPPAQPSGAEPDRDADAAAPGSGDSRRAAA